MRGFDDVSFDWNGTTYKIPANRVLGAIARVEDVITLPELQRHGEKGGMPLAKVAMAYGNLLRYAGAKVTDTQIYEEMFGKGGSADANLVVDAIINLVAMMIPPSAHQTKKEVANKSGNSQAAATKIPKSLKKSTKLLSPKTDGT